MKVIKGKYSLAKVMTDVIDETTQEQLQTIVNQPVFGKSNIVIMPDCHAGAGAVIGFTMKLNDYVIPNIVGVDIGCGVSAYRIGKDKPDFAKLDTFIRENIPYGFKNRNKSYYKFSDSKTTGEISLVFENDIFNACERTGQNFTNVTKQLGTLGGGNHFIEVNYCKETSDYWLVVHTGSRNFGLKIANFYQKRAKELMDKMFIDCEKGLEYLPMDYGGRKYIDDMSVAQEFAEENRDIIAEIILEKFFGMSPCNWNKEENEVKSVHNYIDTYDNIIRKGAISAYKDERVVIPLNMRDGVIIGTGKSNKKWNYSAPHGAGRILSRKKALTSLDIDEFNKEMSGIYSTCICNETLDESPMAYKDSQTIIDLVKETVDIDFIMKPVYSFKAVESKRRKNEYVRKV